MDEGSIKLFLRRIKSHYQNFSLEDIDFKVKEYKKFLEMYDYKDVSERLDMHLKSNNSDQIPSIPKLTVGLTNIYAKRKDKRVYVTDAYVKEPCLLEEYSDKRRRVNSVYYILKNQHFIKRTFDEEKLLKLGQAEFDTLYDRFLKDIYKFLPEKQKENIFNYFNGDV